MKTISPSPLQPTDDKDSDGVFDAEFKPLTAEEAAQWRSAHSVMSPWWIIVWQLVVGLVLTGVTLLWGGVAVASSVAYGAMAVVLPAALMVRGLRRKPGPIQAGAAMMGFVVWETAKIALTVAMLLVAPKVLVPLSWLALVLGFVVTLKVYWVAAWWHSRRR